MQTEYIRAIVLLKDNLCKLYRLYEIYSIWEIPESVYLQIPGREGTIKADFQSILYKDKTGVKSYPIYKEVGYV